MNNKLPKSMQAVTFRHFDRKSYSAFNSLGRKVRIGVLSIAMLTFANVESFSASPLQTEHTRTQQSTEADDDSPETDFTLMEGDLLFEIDNSNQANAVTQVTSGLDGLKISHVAIAVRKHGKTYALEAIKKGVVLTPIDSFLSRPFHSQLPCIAVGRLHDRSQIKRSVRRAMSHLGLPYDVWFLPDNGAYYCSELVQQSFIDKSGNHIFSTKPMTFCDAPGHISEMWQNHFDKLGTKVPEGVEGTNPGDMSKSKAIKIVHLYY